MSRRAGKRPRRRGGERAALVRVWRRRLRGAADVGATVVAHTALAGLAAGRALAGARRRLPRGVRRRLPQALAALAAVLTIACYTQTPRPARPPRAEPQASLSMREEPRVRVALVEAAPELTLALPGAWVVTPDRGEAVALADQEAVVIRPVADGLALEAPARSVGWPGAKGLTIAPGPAAGRALPPAFGLGSRRYRGDVRVSRLDDGRLRLVTGVALEEYLVGVIGHEMPLTWSDAALHAQAIAARTYALVNLKPKADHDLKADERSQVFGGVTALEARARSIVEATRGMVLTWQGKPFTTYFHSTCGGDTVPAAWIFGAGPGNALPPLDGASGCKCQASKVYRWTLEVDLATDAALRKLVLELPLREVSVEAWPRGGYAKTVTFVDAGGDRVTRPGTEVRAAFYPRLKSTAFEVDLDPGGTRLTFRGRGWGHGVGLCQYGAEGFAKEGLTGEQILARAYPGAKLERLGY